MTTVQNSLPTAVLLMGALLGNSACAADSDLAEPDFQLPEGFQIEVLVEEIPNARAMAWGSGDTLFVGSRRAGRLYAVRGALSDSPEVLVMLDGLKLPNGVAYRDGDLYFTVRDQLLRIADIDTKLTDVGEPEVLAELPYGGPLHSWKYLAFGPDGRLYLPLGAPCNVCDREGFATLMSYAADGSDPQTEAVGVRNSVGFDWHPETGELWFTDNGRDMLGDEIPPCELNRLTARGQDFGFPYCHGTDVVDPKFGELGNCADAAAPVQNLVPHSAPLGLRFYTGSMFPKRYFHQVFIAEHGSWNRSSEAGKTGYRVSLVELNEAGQAVAYETFLDGFLVDDQVTGRPVDLLQAPDGALLVSDDAAGKIYRISYVGGSAGLANRSAAVSE